MFPGSLVLCICHSLDPPTYIGSSVSKRFQRESAVISQLGVDSTTNAFEHQLCLSSKISCSDSYPPSRCRTQHQWDNPLPTFILWCCLNGKVSYRGLPLLLVMCKGQKETATRSNAGSYWKRCSSYSGKELCLQSKHSDMPGCSVCLWPLLGA